jgi:hypothetical protein
MKLNLTIIGLIFSASLFCQNRTMTIKNNIESDSSLWYKWQTEKTETFDLIRIENSPYIYHFRLTTHQQIIEIWQNDKVEIHGQITTWTKEHSPKDEIQTNRYFFEKKEIDSLTARRVLKIKDSLNINEIPDESLISEWKQGFDGIVYVFESANKTEYNLKTYWTPNIQDSLVEACKIQEFVDLTLNTLNSQEIIKDFNARIPYECSTNGGTIRCLILTKKDKRKFKKERNNYNQKNN